MLVRLGALCAFAPPGGAGVGQHESANCQHHQRAVFVSFLSSKQAVNNYT
jgi:hypothetical protein